MRSALPVLLLALPLLAQENDEIPPGPLKELMEGLKRGDTEIRIDIHQSRLDSIEHWLQKDRTKGIEDLQKFLAELGPAARAAEPGLGEATAYNDAITLARRHKVAEVKDAYAMQATAQECGLLRFQLPSSARWTYKEEQGGRGAIYQHDRKGTLIRTIAIRVFPKRLTYTHGDKPFDGSNVPMLAKAGMAAAADSVLKVTRRAGVFKKPLNDQIRTTSWFLVEGQAKDGKFVRYRSYYFVTVQALRNREESCKSLAGAALRGIGRSMRMWGLRRSARDAASWSGRRRSATRCTSRRWRSSRRACGSWRRG